LLLKTSILTWFLFFGSISTLGFGFNPGTALLLVDNPYQAKIGALCAVNTFLASAGGCVAALMLKLAQKYRETAEWSFDLLAAMNVSLAGLVAIVSGLYHRILLQYTDGSSLRQVF
jgi:ammonia channel protein AmtB